LLHHPLYLDASLAEHTEPNVEIYKTQSV